MIPDDGNVVVNIYSDGAYKYGSDDVICLGMLLWYSSGFV